MSLGGITAVRADVWPLQDPAGSELTHARMHASLCVCVCGLITASDECLLDSLLTPDVSSFSQHLNCLGLWASQTWLSAQPPASEGSRSRVGSFIMVAPVPITVHK